MDHDNAHLNDVRCGHINVTIPVCGSSRRPSINESPLFDERRFIPEIRAMHKCTPHQLFAREHLDDDAARFIELTEKATLVSLLIGEGNRFDVAIHLIGD